MRFDCTNYCEAESVLLVLADRDRLAKRILVVVFPCEE